MSFFGLEIFYNLCVEKKCTCCELIKPYTEFVKHSYANDGMSYICKSCKNLKYQELKRRKLEGENFVVEKKCELCKQVKPREEFTVSVTRDGLFPYCRECNRKIQNEKYYTEDGRKSHRNSAKKYARKKYSIDDRHKTSRNLSRNFNLILKEGRATEKWSKYEILIGFEVIDFVNKVGDRPSRKHQIDHKIPVSWFSDDCPFSIMWDIRNLWWVTEDYNNKKGNKWCDIVPEDYLEVIRPYLKRDLVFESDVNS